MYVPPADRTTAKKFAARLTTEFGITPTVRFTVPVLGMYVANFTFPAETTDEQMGEIDYLFQECYPLPYFKYERLTKPISKQP